MSGEIKSRALFATVLCGTMVCCWCHGQYLFNMPNSRSVRDPCDSAIAWLKIGHTTLGSADRNKNQFGKDYVAIAKNVTGFEIWKKLCPLDSDGDGLTNGQELGDPKCEWTGDTPNHQTDVKISHPGINEESYIKINCPPPSSTTTTTTTSTTTLSPIV